jgi:hypothetical protein
MSIPAEAAPKSTLAAIPELSPARLRRLLAEVVARLELDLTGACVLTEAASRHFAVTPAIAVAAGAPEVYAVARDSQYATAREAAEHVQEVAGAAGLDVDRIRFVSRDALPARVDIVTNLGALRPLDAEVLGSLGTNGVVTLMCEAWEVRDRDVDLAYCRRHGIPTAGVWEDFEGFDVFRSSGTLASRICMDAGIEVAGNHVVVLSPDRFGEVIPPVLEGNLAKVRRIHSDRELTRETVEWADALLVADYTSTTAVLGTANGPSVAQLAAWNPALVVVQFAGALPVEALRASGLVHHPPLPVGPRRMAFTLSHLGVRPVLTLHAAGLKVGELLWRRKAAGCPFGRFGPLVQEVAKEGWSSR